MIDKNDIAIAARALKAGQLVAFPTETVYGLGADATLDHAVAAIYAAKGRPSFNPLISHVADINAAFALGQFSEPAQKLAKAFWPGPLTIVVERSAHCPVSLLASSGLSSIAIRVPDHPIALELLRKVDRPVVAPSANISGRMSPTSAAHVKAQLGDRIAMALDGGDCRVGLESTIVSFLDDEPKVLRSGGISREKLFEVLGFEISLSIGQAVLHAPGQLESHYAPNATLRLNADYPYTDEIFIGFGAIQFGPHTFSGSGDLTEAAANLFRLLHKIDADAPAKIAVAPIPNHGLGEAINDRLRRAAAPRNVLK
jgi:L-threonylcarbamoyladenylate synthase